MTRPMVMGLGNPDRGDDGIAFHIVNRLRRRLGSRPLSDGETGLGGTETKAALLFVRQLVPELVLDVGGCSRLIFVDAHVPAEPRTIVCARIRPEARTAAGLTHALPPEGFLWLLQALAGRSPESFLVSLRGERFDFTRRDRKSTRLNSSPVRQSRMPSSACQTNNLRQKAYINQQ